MLHLIKRGKLARSMDGERTATAPLGSNSGEPAKPPMMKSHRGRPIWQFYCPYCGVTRRLPFHPRPEAPVHLARMGLATLFTTLVLWEWFGWKGLLSAFPIWATFELAYRLRIRAALACSTCGFDPYLYKSNLPHARSEIEAKWREKFAERGIPFPEKPDSLRRANPVEVSPPES